MQNYYIYIEYANFFPFFSINGGKKAENKSFVGQYCRDAACRVLGGGKYKIVTWQAGVSVEERQNPVTWHAGFVAGESKVQ